MEVTLDIVLGSGPELGDGELDDGDEGSDDDGGDTAALVFGGRHPFDSRPLPVLHCVGWFDNILIPSMRDYTTLIGRAEWAPLQFLWADSVDHENYHLDDMPITADNDHGLDDAVLEHVLDRYATPALDFFDVFVKGIGDAASLPRVWWHLGHVGYRSSPAWPPVGATERRLHLGDLHPPHRPAARSAATRCRSRSPSGGCTTQTGWSPPPSRTRSRSSTTIPTNGQSPIVTT